MEEAVPRGSYRQFLLDNAQPDTYYRVTAYAGETELDSTMLRYEDPTAVALSVSDIAYEDGEAAVTLTGRNHESGVRRLALALYEGGRMAACGFADAAQLNGSQTLDFPLGKLADGRYDYKLFIFDDVDSEVPYMAAKTGSVTIGD